MMNNNLPGKIFLFICFLLLQTSVSAGEHYRGRILKVNGDVHVINEKGQMRKLEESKFLVRELDTIVTGKGGNAVVKFNDGSMSVRSEKSKLRVEKTNWLSHIGGRIYFTFRKIFGKPKRVSTRFATMGIRGTTFIISDDESGQGIALQEGVVDVESLEGEFEIHRNKEMDEFEAFKQQARDRQAQLRNEFDAYKKQTMQEFVEYKKQFTLEPNRVIRFDGNRVDDAEMTEQDEQEFTSFEEIAGEMLRQFRKQSKEHRDKQTEIEDIEASLEE